MPSVGAPATLIQSGGATEAVTANGNGNGVPDRSLSTQDEILAGLEGLDMSGNNNSSLLAAEATESGAGAPLIDHGQLVDSPVRSTFAAAPASPTSPIQDRNGSVQATSTPVTAPAPVLTPGYEKQFHRLCYSTEGVLFEDNQLQIGIKSEYHGHQGRIALFFGNKISVGFKSFTVTVKSQSPEALIVTIPKMSSSSLGAMSQVQQVIQMECKDYFSSPPILKVSYLAGSMQELTLRLPVLSHKFVEPVQLASNDFFERWKQIGGAPREAQKIFSFKLGKDGNVDTVRNRKVVAGSRLQVLEGIDPNPVNIVAAGVLHTSSSGKVGCLLRLEPNKEAKVSC